MKYTLLILFLLASCTGYEQISASASGNYSRTRLVKLGGSADQHSSDGSGIVVDDQKSFSDGATALTLLGGSLATTSVNKAKEVTKRTADANATRLARDKVAADLAAQQAALSAKEGATKAAIGAGAVPTVGTITPP